MMLRFVGLLINARNDIAAVVVQ